ncbi:MAG: hypothetical protein ACKO2P_00420 [Planctomycetota bacterium]
MWNRSNTVTMTLACVVAVVFFSQGACAQTLTKKALKREKMLDAAGAIDGAVWSYTLKPRPATGATGKQLLRGRYRVSDLEIFQGETRDAELTQKVGTSKFTSGNSATAEFEKLRGFTVDKKWVEVRGTALMKLQKFGHWEGVFIDSDDFKWDMTIRRIRE